MDVRSRDASFGPRASWEVRHTYTHSGSSASACLTSVPSPLRSLAARSMPSLSRTTSASAIYSAGGPKSRSWRQARRATGRCSSFTSSRTWEAQLLASFCAFPSIYAAWEPHHWSTAPYLIGRSGMRAVHTPPNIHTHPIIRLYHFFVFRSYCETSGRALRSAQVVCVDTVEGCGFHCYSRPRPAVAYVSYAPPLN